MHKRPFYLTCPKCGHLRFVLPVVKTYRCASCGSQLRVRSQGSYLVESMLLAPVSLLLYWSAASILHSRGLDREAAQGWGILVAFVISLPCYAAIRPYLVGIECIDSEAKDENLAKRDQGVNGGES